MRLILTLVTAILLSVPVFAADKAVSESQNKMKQCAANWQQMKADGKTEGKDYKTYSAACLKGDTSTDSNNKMKACADEWNSLKAQNKTEGKSYKEFSTACLKK